MQGKVLLLQCNILANRKLDGKTPHEIYVNLIFVNYFTIS